MWSGVKPRYRMALPKPSNMEKRTMTEAASSAPADTPSSDPLMQPFTLRHLTLKNRVMSTSHAISYVEDGMPKERYQLYHEEKAKGGLALTMFGGSSNVAPDSPSVFSQIYVAEDRIIPHLQEFSERIHAHDCALMIQLTHMGRRSSSFTGDWLPIIAPSRVREPQHRSFPKEMDRSDIDRVVEAYGRAAWRCREGGLDGCEVLAGGHLLGQFLSPVTNLRTDAFGGSIENRCRFGLMMYEEMRKQAGDDYIMGIRMPIHEASDDGLSMDDGIEIARIFEASGLVDFFNVIVGRMDTELALAETNMPGMASRSAPFLDDVAVFKRETKLPVFHAARVAEAATARHALREGHVDMIGMTRAHIADPHIVAKIARGEEDRIRPCVGATYCNTSRRVCIHNTAVGREAMLPHVIERTDGRLKNIVVIGGGPAGLEAARVCAARGHKVTLHEAGAELGGQLAIAARASWRNDLKGIIDWLVAETQHLGVSVHLNSFVEPEEVLQSNPDIVVVATGGLPDLDWIDGADHCVSTWDVLTGAAVRGEDVLVWDGTGVNAAATCADHLAVAGSSVILATPDNVVSPEVSYIDRVVQQKRLYEFGVDFLLDHGLKRVEPAGNRYKVVLENVLTGAQTERLVDQVVVEHGTVPAQEIYDALAPRSANGGVTDIDALLGGSEQPHDDVADGAFTLYRVGDVVASRDVHAAILDALRLCVRF
jgi:2,4-dienoyl-CoA reductase-like NADH-dependent reductase (Old Yellow Enzyme family)/thioredoxin reductase